MARTLIERSARAHRPERLDRCVSARPAGLTNAFDDRRRLRRVEAAALVPGVEFLSASLYPSDGLVRIDLLAPLLSAVERQCIETEFRSTAVPDSPGGTINSAGG